MLSTILDIVKNIIGIIFITKKRSIDVEEKQVENEYKTNIAKVKNEIAVLNEKIQLGIANNEDISELWAKKKSKKKILNQLEESLNDERNEK